jgi:lysophospholipase L1-like esterase
VRIPLDAATAAAFFPANEEGRYRYDPLAYSLPAPNPDAAWAAFAEHPAGGFHLRVNALGLREDHETETAKRDLRVLVGGDSHTYGVCANQESFANVLEQLLADELPGRDVEVLNGGAGYHHFYNYLGTFERLAFLDPDVFVLVAFGGNDFSGSMILQRYFHARPPPAVEPHSVSPGDYAAGVGPQETGQVAYFLNNPEDEAVAVRTAVAITEEIRRLCLERGTELLVAYLPSPFRGQPELFAKGVQRSLEVMGCGEEALAVSDRLADAWLQALRRSGMRALDLRPAFRAAAGRLYWSSDLHLNVTGHRLVAHELAVELVPLLSGISPP